MDQERYFFTDYFKIYWLLWSISFLLFFLWPVQYNLIFPLKVIIKACASVLESLTLWQFILFQWGSQTGLTEFSLKWFLFLPPVPINTGWCFFLAVCLFQNISQSPMWGAFLCCLLEATLLLTKSMQSNRSRDQASIKKQCKLFRISVFMVWSYLLKFMRSRNSFFVVVVICFLFLSLKIPNIAKKLEDFKKDVEAKKKPPSDKS